MTRLLRSLGYLPIAVGSISKALEQMAAEPLDIVLVDHHLGADDGFELAPKMRKLASERALPKIPLIIGMTGSGDLENVDEYELDGCLLKHFSADQLRELLERKIS